MYVVTSCGGAEQDALPDPSKCLTISSWGKVLLCIQAAPLLFHVVPVLMMKNQSLSSWGGILGNICERIFLFAVSVKIYLLNTFNAINISCYL